MTQRTVKKQDYAHNWRRTASCYSQEVCPLKHFRRNQQMNTSHRSSIHLVFSSLVCHLPSFCLPINPTITNTYDAGRSSQLFTDTNSRSTNHILKSLLMFYSNTSNSLLPQFYTCLNYVQPCKQFLFYLPMCKNLSHLDL